VAVSALSVVPLREAEDARYAAVDTLTARLAAEENAERAKLAAAEALNAQRAAEEAVEQARLALEHAEQARIADEKSAERARRTAEETLQAWRETITAEDRRPPERLRVLPPLPETELQAAGLGIEETPGVEAHETDPPADEEPEPELPTAEERSLTATCKISFWRGYRKGAFYARAFDEEGYEIALAESPQFKPRGNEVPEETDEAVAAYEALVAQLAEAGWQADGRDDTWFGQTFRV
jgi:hypothetical protein